MFRTAQNMVRTGRWREASDLFYSILQIDPYDSHTHLALSRLESRREKSVKFDDDEEEEEDRQQQQQGESAATAAFRRGTQYCPDSVHLWQAWALHEQSVGNEDMAKDLFETALTLDGGDNPYVCHAFGLMELENGNVERAKGLWEKALTRQSTAALLCSLGDLYISTNQLNKARDLYARHVFRIKKPKEMNEVYLAAAWLEERYYRDFDRAVELLECALRRNVGDSRVSVALARLEGRRVGKGGGVSASGNGVAEQNGGGRKQTTDAVRKKLEEACLQLGNSDASSGSDGQRRLPSAHHAKDGRLFNALANLEVKAGRLPLARKILSEGIRTFPKDHSLLQAAGKVEERSGNYTAARDLYSDSLLIEPSAPTLVAYALLELHHPSQTDNNNKKSKRQPKYNMIRKLFEEALLLDPRHGPAYNAYGNMELRRGNIAKARKVYSTGVKSRCTDPASVYHGLAKLELSVGNISAARKALIRGLEEVERLDRMMDSGARKRGAFLTHTLGMLELNRNRPVDANSVFEKGMARFGSSSQLLLGKALSQGKMGNEEAARKLFERAVDADRDHAQAWQAWGVMEMRAGNYKVAKTLFECGLRSAPEHGALWQAYAIMESRRGNMEVARALFTAGVKKCPRHVPLYEAWACLESRGGNYIQAKQLIGEALTRNKKQGSGWLVAAKIEEKLGNDGLVGLILRKGLEYAPNDPKLYCALAEHDVMKGKIDEARDLLEKGLEIDPLHAPLYHSLAELEARIGNLQALSDLHKRAMKVFKTNALDPPSPLEQEAWMIKIRAQADDASLPDEIAALAEEVGVSTGTRMMMMENDKSLDPGVGQFEDDIFEERGESSPDAK